MKTISVIVFLKLFIILSNTYQQMWITFRQLWIKVYNLFTFQPPHNYYLYNYNNNPHATNDSTQLNTISIQLHTIHYNIYTSSSNIPQLYNNYDYCAILSYFVPLLSHITIIIMIILHTITLILYIIIYYYTNITYNNNTIT